MKVQSWATTALALGGTCLVLSFGNLRAFASPSKATETTSAATATVAKSFAALIAKQRTVQFPKDASDSPGTALLLPATASGAASSKTAKLKGPAVGAITVPKDHVLYLIVTPEGASKLGCLTNLNEGDLHRIRLHDVRLPKTGPKDLARVKGLRDLDLSNTDINDEGLKEIANSKAIVKLDVSKTLVHGPGIEKLGNLKELRDLDVGNNNINDFYVAMLVRSLPQLEALNLSETKITDKALQSVCQLKNLRKLDLEGNKITDKGLTSLENCSNLKSLNLRNTFVSSAGMRKYFNSNPQCKIRH